MRAVPLWVVVEKSLLNSKSPAIWELERKGLVSSIVPQCNNVQRWGDQSVAIPDGIEVLNPWRVIDDGSESPNRADDLSARLQSEIREEHVLHGLRLKAVATRIDRDDVLFEIDGGHMPLAVVHMTWRKETNPDWPRTKLFPSWEDWVLNEMLPAHEGFE